MRYVAVVLFLSTTLVQAQFINNTGIEIVNSTRLTVNGDWVNAAGTAIRNDGVISTSEDWTNNGALNTASQGGFELRYSADRNFIPGGTNFGFLTKQGTGNATISGAFSLRDSLTISGGLIRPAVSSDVLTVAETGKVKAVAGSFLDGGKLVRRGTGSLFFPLGKNGLSLPITFLNVSGTAPSVSVSIEDAPGGYTVGPGVNALISFPYIWRAIKANVADSSSYVEIEYPNTLPTASDVVVVRKISGQNRYEGMGARLVTTTANTVKVRSYSRGLNGTFSIARGFRGNLATDSLALLALYQSTVGSSWTNKTNWTTGRVGTWQGITETGGLITAVNLPNNKITGSVPDSFADIAALQTVNLSGNAITQLPVLTGATGITTLNVSNNRLDFGSLEENASIPGINYANQALIGSGVDVQVNVGLPFQFKVDVKGQSNQYQWKRNGQNVTGATATTFDIAAIGRSNMGSYVCEIVNSRVPGLVLRSSNQRALAVASIEGNITANNSPVAAGRVYLFKINPPGSAFDTTFVKNINPSGSYKLDNVILDDYLLAAQGDRTQYAGYFPTYWKGTPFWEEADSIFLNEFRTGVNISLAALPTVRPTGDGDISGIFIDRTTGGRTQSDRVANASATVRRAKVSSRPTAALTAEEVIAFVYTNSNGEFDFSSLNEGSYLLNLQYPGLPMDPKSDIVIALGPKSKRQNSQKVIATAAGGKITVKKLLIVGLDEEENEIVKVFPNPTSSQLSISLASPGEVTASLFDTLGKEVLSRGFTNDEEKLDVSALPSGMYLLVIYKNGKPVNRSRVVKE
ncbi:MAG: T9SS type A sorting domain-containing protein [Cyclobacteriaceae bacterium]|nr:T9SS type A sorting domain-containing protein [Cyclobacteriaceae bacterium]